MKAAPEIFDNSALPDAIHADSPPILIEFYELYLDHTQKVIGDMLSTDTNTNLPDLREQAHSIKSSSMTIGAQALAHELDTLEQVAASQDASRAAAILNALEPVAEQTFQIIRVEIETLRQSS